MDITLIFLIGIFGLFVGSFLNVIIYRLHAGEQFLRGRSHCPHCGHTLSWYELIPLASFALQRGKCRSCHKAISWQYPLVELATGIVFAFSIWHISSKLDFFSQSVPYLLSTIFYLLVISGLIVIFVYDLKNYIIPDKILIFLIVTVFVAQLFGIPNGLAISHLGIENFGFDWSLVIGHWDFGTAAKSIISGIIAALPFFGIVFFSKGAWMGLGDVKFAFFMGMLLGAPGAFLAIFFAVILGAIIGVALIAAGKKGLKSEIPFGPFLIVGTFVSLFYGNDIWHFYMRMLGVE